MNLKLKISLIIVLFLSCWTQAKTKVFMSIEETQGKLEFRIPTIEVLGFNEAKTIKQRRKLFELIGYFESEISKILTLDKKLNCTVSKERIGLTKDDYDKAASESTAKTKGEFLAAFHIECKTSLVGSEVHINLTKKKQIKELALNLQIGENVNKSFNSKNKLITFELK